MSEEKTVHRKVTHFQEGEKLWAIESVKCNRTQQNILWSNRERQDVRPGTFTQDTNAQQLPFLTVPRSPNLALMRHS